MRKIKNKLQKYMCFIIVFVMLLNINYVWADLEDNETISIDEIKEEVVETTNVIDNEPKLNSRIGLIYDRASGRILYEKNGNKQTPMASTTKIMTAIVVLEKSNLTDVVTIDAKSAGTGGSRLGLKKNDKITVKDLLYGLMLKSGNDAAVALAVHIGGSIERFAELMNQKAKELGLVNSHFVVPHGLDMEGHYTTAYELAKMADYALNIEKFKEIVGTKTYTVTINGQPKVISNTNELLGNLNGVYGIKTGFTNGAGRCLVSACKRDDLDIITVVIGADTKKYRTSDSMQLIEYAYRNFQIVDIQQIIKEKFKEWKDMNENRIIINKGIEKEVCLELEQLPYKKIAIKNTQIDNIEIEVNSLFYLEAPVAEKEIIGNLKIKVENEIIVVQNIYNTSEIRKKQIGDYLKEFLKVYNKI